MPSTKQKIADIQAGRIFRCLNCDKTCDDEYTSDAFKNDDVYLGRVDTTKSRKEHYCSRSCMFYYYRQEITPSIQTYSDQFTRRLSASKDGYKMALLNPPSTLMPSDVDEECDCGLSSCVCSINDNDDFMEFISIENKKRMEEYEESLQEFKHCISFFVHAQKLFRACLERKSEYELHELQLKALHLAGPLTEYVHTDGDKLNKVLKWHHFIKCVNISAMSC
jgi:hypothetical protein